MPLSDDDQRQFDEIARALLEDDPVFSEATTMDRYRRRRLYATFATFCAGFVLLIAGAVTTQGSLPWGVLISVAGFLVMTGALYFHRWSGRREADLTRAR